MNSTEGIVLKKIDSGEADAFFVIYTKDFGKIRARAQGVKKEEAKLKGHLETLNLASISFVLGKNGERLTSAVVLNHWPRIRENFEKLNAALAAANLVDEKCFPGDKDERLWELFLENFLVLNRKEPDAGKTPEFLQNFRENLTAVLGYAGVPEPGFLRYNN